MLLSLKRDVKLYSLNTLAKSAVTTKHWTVKRKETISRDRPVSIIYSKDEKRPAEVVD